MSAVPERVNEDRVAALRQDITDRPDLYQERWDATNPERRDFVTRRALYLFEGNHESLRKVMALVVEIDNYDVQTAFAADMTERILAPAHEKLGSVALPDVIDVTPLVVGGDVAA